jgi:putative SOS response-associated peptidase YedK
MRCIFKGEQPANLPAQAPTKYLLEEARPERQDQAGLRGRYGERRRDGDGPGLWSKWRDPASREEVLICTVLTCAPNNAMAEIHNRMPIILNERDWPKWLGEEPATELELLALLRPCPDEWLKIWPVDNKVGNVRNTGRELMLPPEEPLL